jgi:glycosyltransferase involved in cell wall biosynthesis
MRIVFNLMNHFNPFSGGISVMLSAMRILKKADFHVCVYYYSYDEQKSIHFDLEKDFQILGFDDLDPKNDVVVVAEEFIWIAYDFLKQKGIKYVIFNQGIFASLYSHNSYNEHKKSYQDALAVLVNSIHTANGVEKLFDVDQKNIFYYRIGIDTSLYYPEQKENLATCLVYKNGNFVRFMNSYFADKYPDWKIKMIELLPKEETAALFRKSKIFLSFGGPEGFGLPPLEAAFCGCKVIGFHGEAGKEYFKEPVFTSVNFMDHLEFVDKLDVFMKHVDDANIKPYNDYIDYLKYFYSREKETESIINFFIYIRDSFFRKNI